MKDNSSQSVMNKAQITPSMIPSPTAPVSSTSSNTTTRLPRTHQLPTFLLWPSASPPPSPAARNFAVATPSSTSVTVSLKASPAKGKTPMIAVNGNEYIPMSPPKSSGLASTPVGPPHKNPSPSHPGRAFALDFGGCGLLLATTYRQPPRTSTNARSWGLAFSGHHPSQPSKSSMNTQFRWLWASADHRHTPSASLHNRRKQVFALVFGSCASSGCIHHPLSTTLLQPTKMSSECSFSAIVASSGRQPPPPHNPEIEHSCSISVCCDLRDDLIGSILLCAITIPDVPLHVM